jgi:hypothetical protein
MTQIKKTISTNARAVDLNGQWFGFYKYGPEYGPKVEGEKIIFSIIIEQQDDRSFTGKCVEINGIGASSEIARLQGYIDDTFISFVKHYKKHPTLDSAGNPVELDSVSSTRLMYSGTIDLETDTITGKWEIWLDDVDAPEGDPSEVTTGTWEISRDPARYGI